MLFRQNLNQVLQLAFRKAGGYAYGFFLFFRLLVLVLGFLVDGEETGKLNRRAGSA